MKNKAKRPGRPPQPLKRDRDGRPFLYCQLADIVRDQIKSGKLKPGDRLPSMDDLARTYALNKITVRRGLAQLYAAGLIYSVPAQGTYVAENRPLTTFSLQRRPLTVGLITPESKDAEPSHVEIIQGIRDELARLQGSLVMIPLRAGEPEVRVLSRLARAQLDAMIYLGMPDSSLMRRLIEQGPPAILADCANPGIPASAITLDNRGGGALVMNHLLGLGHRNIMVVTGRDALRSTQDRLAGVHDALERAGLPHDSVTVMVCDGRRENAQRLTASALKSGFKPTAICAFSDEMAVGAIQFLADQASLNVPRDVSVTGFDDTPWAAASQPPLTTVHMDLDQMGRLAVRRVWGHFKDREPVTMTILPAQLIVRNSTAPCR